MSGITICHSALPNGGSTWEQLTIDQNAISSHENHLNDIIPPINGVNGYPGLNWQPPNIGIWANGCVEPFPTPTPTPREFWTTDHVAGMAILVVAFIVLLIGAVGAVLEGGRR